MSIPGAGDQRGSEYRHGYAILAAALSSMLAPLNSTMIVVALPDLLREFDRPLAWGSWIVIAYLVAMATVQPLAGSLGDRYGRRRLIVGGLTAFLLASIVAGLAWRIEVLFAARTAQAVAGAVAIPNGMALVRALVPTSQQGRASGVIGAGIAVAAGLGPPIGGLVTGALGWRWIFLFNLLLILPALWLIARLPAESASHERRPFDLRGATLMTCSLVTTVLALTIWRVPGMPLVAPGLLGLAGVVCGIGFWRHVRRSPNPLIRLELFRAPGFSPAAGAVLLSNLALYTLLLSLPIFLVRRDGWNPRQVGLLLAGLSLQMVIFSPLGGRLSDSHGRRLPATAGALLVAIGLLPLLGISQHWEWPMLLAILIVVGVGMGLSSAPVQASAVLAVSPQRAGQASGLFSTMRYLGSIVGSTMLTVILTGDTPSLSQFRLLYLILFLAAASATLVAARLPGPATTPTRAASQPGTPGPASD